MYTFFCKTVNNLLFEFCNCLLFQIQDLDLETNRDYILIRDGDSPKSRPITRLTGTTENNPNLIMSTGNQLYLYLKTSLGDSRRGFKIKYSQGNFMVFIY